MPRNLFNREKMTYLMYDKASGYYKIGRSEDVGRRYKELHSTCPGLLLIRVCCVDIEKILHSMFDLNCKLGNFCCLHLINFRTTSGHVLQIQNLGSQPNKVCTFIVSINGPNIIFTES